MFRHLEASLTKAIERVREQAHRCRAELVLAGILPTLMQSDLSIDNMTPRARYAALNDALNRARGGRYLIYIQGTDELHIEHDSAMFEGCNTSFQMHLQVDPDDFAGLYNVAQAIAAPVLAAATGSPLLFGKRLWAETRIALFQRAIDTRGATPHVRDVTPRVRFGERWLEPSVLELFQEDIARIPALVGVEIDEDPFRILRMGGSRSFGPCSSTTAPCINGIGLAMASRATSPISGSSAAFFPLVPASSTKSPTLRSGSG